MKRIQGVFGLVVVAGLMLGSARGEAPAHEAIVVRLAPGYNAMLVSGAAAAKRPTGVPGLDPILQDWMLSSVKPVFGRTGKPVLNPELFEQLGMDRDLLVGWVPGSPQPSAGMLNQILGQLGQLSAVEEAYLNEMATGAFTPDDPDLSNQWHHAVIGSTQAWAVTTGSTNILIAVVDSGLSSSNADFNYSLITNGYDYVESDWNPEDEIGHGTHVAGIIAAQGDNATDVAGLAWGCRLLNIRVINESNSCTWANTAAGIQEAADSGASVINLSIQGCGGSSVLSNAVAYAHGLDCVIAACMGNYDTSWVIYPAGYPETIAVGMTASNDARYGSSCSLNTTCTTWDFGSDFGPHIDVVAPGYSILSTVMSGTANYSGTSMATPMVAAMAGLLRDIRPDYDNEKIRELIHASCVDLVGDACEDVAGFDNYMGYGRIMFGFGVFVASASTNCALTYAAAAMGPPPPMFADYYWLRDTKLSPLPAGKALVKDYYAASPAIVGAAVKDPWITVGLVAMAREALPLVGHIRTKPGVPVQIPRELWRDACGVADAVLEAVDATTRTRLQPWVTRGKTNPVKLLADLGIQAVLVGQ